MKTTGIVRKVDELGRVVIPIELRRTLNIDTKDAIEIFVDGESIILRKYEANWACAITGEVSNNNLKLADGKLILSPEAARKLADEISDKSKRQKALSQII